MTRSVSQLEQYEQCGHQYYLRRVQRVTPRPAAWSHQGTAFHSAIEAYERSGRQLAVGVVTEMFSDEYTSLTTRAMREEPRLDRWMTAGRKAPVADIEDRHTLGREQAAAYVAWAQDKGPSIWKAPDGKLGIELHLTVEIGGVTVQGYVDQLPVEPTGSVRVRDLKTGSMKSKFQLQTYGVLVRKALGLEVERGDWYMAKKGSLSRPVDLAQVPEEEIGRRFADMDQGVKAGRFPASPGFHCRFCDVSHSCSFFSS
ncbi:RecB family exonuclease [Streptomyces buecherae]|uniref:RecB family exonuclease n=1 Tax=Streptomyces buecherae TaxID=2763006 RepID=UPI00164D3DFE|nr:PD-(D/E)XK nuclease family protein [Streptomyces buecherae]QNJ44495.1 PD-(D/E)XK nuclease family protein [Streptomyces buecherae]